jgi:hypothetical protein
MARAERVESGRIDPGRADASGGRRARRGLLVAGIVLLVLIAVIVIADLVVRSIAQTTVAQAVEDELPEQVSGEVTAEIGGFSVLAQLIAGTAERVELTAPELLVDGTPIAVVVVATGVPLDFAQPVGRIDAEVRIDQASLDELALTQGVVGDLTLGDGVVGYTGSLEILGFPVEYRATAEPEAAGDRVLLRPVGAEVTAGGASLDLSGAVDAVLGGDPVEICVADRLPEGLALESIEVTTGEAVLHLGGSGLILDEEHLAQTGSC